MAERIIIGADVNEPLYTFDNSTIKECVCVLSSSLVGDQIAVDQFMPVVYSAGYVRVKLVPKGSTGLITADGKIMMVYSNIGFLDKLPYGTPIWYYSGETLMGKFYFARALRTSKVHFDILAVSAIGLMDGQKHYGGVYQGQTFEEVAMDIIGNTASFSCSEDVASIGVYGWLPFATRRENLHQLLFATGVQLGKDQNGEIYFHFPDSERLKSVSDGRIFYGGQINYMTPATKAEVTEHAFLPIETAARETLYDNTDGSGEAVHTVVSFVSAPVFSLEVTGNLTIEESGVNYAIVSGTGTLTGVPYTHATKVVEKRTEGAESQEKVVSVTNATLVHAANSANVANRVLSYYASARTIASDIVLADEKPGDQIAFTNPFGEPETAFLSSMEINASSFLRANCELVAGYIPSGQGNNYSEAVVLIGSGSWVAPGGKGRIAVIGAGSGGDSGGNGGNQDSRNPGDGGINGNGGAPGKIYVTDVDFVEGATYEYRCGVAGIGGIPNDTEESVPGTAGTETTFGPYSSADGATSTNGYANLFTGEIFALPGADGIPGSVGASNSEDSPNVFYNGKMYYPGARGKDYYDEEYGRAYGGYGGGPAAGANGGPGGNARLYAFDDDPEAVGGRGGDGATPVDGRDAKTYGSGGEGGHGGGGAGQKGGPYDGWLHSGSGVGGKGSKGGDAMPGCIVIYLEG